MSLLLSTHDMCWRHDTGWGHPERPERLSAIRDGLRYSSIGEAVTWIEAPKADVERILAVHPASFFERIGSLADMGGGSLDPDTIVSPESGDAALRAAGAGLDLIDRLDRGEADAGWSLVRPPGHHATRWTQMGFCLLNNIAIAGRALAERGERVAIVDFDAHHGNGTQDVFYNDPNVLFVSMHQYPCYPGTGSAAETGEGAGQGTTINVPLPPRTTGDVYRKALDEVLLPRLEAFAPTWLLISAGFDAHGADPLTDMSLTSGDFADITRELLPLVPAGRRLLFLEGGYDLQALADSAISVAGALLGQTIRLESPSSGGPGAEQVEQLAQSLSQLRAAE